MDDPAGIVRSNPLRTGSCSLLYANVTSRKRMAEAGSLSGFFWPDAMEPALFIAGPKRSTAATGDAAQSSAQFSPPNAIIELATAHWANITAAPRSMLPFAAADARDQRTTTLAPITIMEPE